MKKFILYAIASLYIGAFAQNNNDAVYYLTRTMSLKQYNFNANPPAPSSTTIIAQKGWRFVVDQPDNTGYVIKFLKWENDNNPNNQTIYATVNTVAMLDSKGNIQQVSQETINFYHITKQDFENFTKKYVQDNPKFGFVTGAITVPIKIRPAGSKKDSNGNKLRPSDFTGDINIGLSIGLRIRLDKSGKGFLIPSAGLNLSSVSIDENTVRNGVITTKTNASSLTPFMGIIGEYDKFQIALITGWDRLAGKVGENWIYQGKPWFGVGLGYNIFNTSNNKPDNNEED